MGIIDLVEAEVKEFLPSVLLSLTCGKFSPLVEGVGIQEGNCKHNFPIIILKIFLMIIKMRLQLISECVVFPS